MHLPKATWLEYCGDSAVLPKNLTEFNLRGWFRGLGANLMYRRRCLRRYLSWGSNPAPATSLFASSRRGNSVKVTAVGYSIKPTFGRHAKRRLF